MDFSTKTAMPVIRSERFRTPLNTEKRIGLWVDRIGTGKARQVNARFAAMASHYLFEPEFCNPASGWEKGQVEKNVQDALLMAE